MDKETHIGQCHCGAVKFSFKVSNPINVTECDCSICSMTAYQHIFVPKDDLVFESGQDNLAVYTFNTRAAKHMFCKSCGIKPLYIPRSHPDNYSINLRCVTSNSLKISKTIQFLGKNWKANIAALHEDT